MRMGIRRLRDMIMARQQQVNNTLFTLPVLLIVLIAALDSADKGLLASSFPMLEQELGMDVATLGYFSLFTNLSYSLSLPFWGWLIHRAGVSQSPTILAASCHLWGLATIGIAWAGSSSVMAQAIFRSINGAAVASILPLSQTMLVQLVGVGGAAAAAPKKNDANNNMMLGRAFGLLGLAEKVAATTASASIVWYEDWKKPYLCVGTSSIVAAFLAQRYLKMGNDPLSNNNNNKNKQQQDNHKEKMTLCQIVSRIAKIPAFLCLVGQGVSGGIPWDMMSFVLLLLEWKGFTKEQIVMIQFSQGISGTLGVPVGGFLGDYFAVMYSIRGRIYVALSSVAMGIVSFGAFLYSNSYYWSFFFGNLFHFVACWTPAAANRPICAEIAQNASERAQIVAMWILLEKTSSAIFGAPLVGYLTSGMIDESNNGVVSKDEKVQALAYNLFSLSALFWIICCFFWALMAYNVDVSVSTTIRAYKKIDQQDEEDIERRGIMHS